MMGIGARIMHGEKVSSNKTEKYTQAPFNTMNLPEEIIYPRMRRNYTRGSLKITNLKAKVNSKRGGSILIKVSLRII